MERHVKERLIGAAVLMAAAVILIPEMLSGPERKDTAPEAQAKLDAPLKTYTIDLQQPAKPPTGTVIEERAPPPEQTPSVDEASAQPPDAQTQAIPEQSAAIAPTSPTTRAVEATEPPAVTNPKAPPEQTTAASQPSVRQAAPPTVESTVRSGWAVQLGSFSKEESARRLAEDTRRSGHEAFVMPVRSGAATLYRVRVGPMSDRASAEATLAALKGKAPGAAVVAHP